MKKEVEILLKGKTDTQDIEDLKEDLEEVGEGAKKAQISIKNLMYSITKVATTVKKITDITDDYATSQNILAQTFGVKSVDGINAYISSMNKMTGISETSLSKSTAMFGQMSTSMGMSSKMAKEFSLNLDTLSAKLAMIYNIDYSRASKSLVDAVKGESSTLTSLTGIVIKTQSLQNTLDKLELELDASKLNGANLAMLQYITVANQVNATNGELQRTVNGVAWQKKLLSNQVKELATAVGRVLYPVLETVLPVFNAILIVITNIINMLASLLGYNGDLIGSLGEATDSWDSYGGAIEKASTKAKKSLRGFDKLNNITTPTPTNTTGGGAGINRGLLDAMRKTNEQMLNIRNKAQEIADKIMEWLGFTKDINGEWKFSKITLGTVIGAFIGGGGLIWAISEIFKLLKNITGIGGLFGALFGSKSGSSSGGVFQVPKVSTILKGLADLTLIVAGLGALVWAVGKVTKIEGFSDTVSKGITQLKDLFFGLGAIAIPLMAMSALIAVLGAITPATVVAGIAGLVLIIASLEGLVYVIGKLAQSENFNFLIDTGLTALATLFEGLGFAFGKLVAGIGEGIASALPQIGTYLAEFSTNASPFFEEVKNIDESSMNGVKALAEAILILTEANILDGLTRWLTGGNSLEKFGEMLPDFGKNIKKYATAIKGINGQDVEASANSAKSLAEMARIIPNDGGFISLFTGDNNIADFGETLPSFGRDFAQYAEYVKNIDNAVVEGSANSAKSLAEMARIIPNDGGFISLFTGDNNIADFGENLADFGMSFSEYYNNISGINTDKINTLTEAIHKLVVLAYTIKNNGIGNTMSDFANNLKKSSDKFNEFFSKTQGYDIGYGFGSSMGKGITQALKNTKFPNISLKEGGWWGNTVKTYGITAYANGGFPEDGLFYANHNELVGKFANGKTAVANNDQILTGIENGVTNGMVRALSVADIGGNQPIYVKAQFGADEVTDWIQVQQKKRSRQYDF